MDFENPITNPNPRDDTFKRIINDNHNGFYTTTYSTYGNFKNPEKNICMKELEKVILINF